MMSLRSGCGLQAELAHFASAAVMNLTVSSSGDPQRDSWATVDEANPLRRNKTSPRAGMIDDDFMVSISWRFYLTDLCVASVNPTSPDKTGIRQAMG